ncbi:ATP-binding protein [Stappia sp. ES.058]|uniref:ATP-binding protein n=1 Tax=Stappia sp. ES.058 TaxID=1881061 RepID=UPI00087A5A8A|nr:ATP-binding protein [Stappia sp. ES.058]SDU41464.1 His Kinase A (phospho-acceptor) domain-containing protein [Stappia sp. ES.058]
MSDAPTPPDGPDPQDGTGLDADLAGLLHDLRTPLSAMRTAVELIDLDPTTSRQASAIQTLEMAIDALLAMTQDLLDPGGAPTVRASTADTAVDAISAVTDLFTADARSRGLRIDCTIAGDLEAYGIGDPLTLRRVLSVLIDNALKYTGEGRITVTAHATHGGARPALEIDVSDTGIGIPAAEQGNLFRPRKRGAQASATTAGSGLGLWSAARLAASAGGRLDLVETSAMGTTFGLRLPLVAPAPDPARADDGTSNIRTLPRRSVLVVDDNETSRRMIEAMLDAFGVDVFLADGGRDALACLAAEPVNAVLLDINMPDMDGLETLAAIRALDGNPASLPVIGITAAIIPNHRKLEDAGFQAILDKPVAPAVLFAALDRAMTEAGGAGSAKA